MRRALNINSWLLFLLYAFSSGVDFTMSNGAAMYFHQEFDEPVALVGALAFLYGISALYARAVGGYMSDVMSEAFSLRGRLLAQFLCMSIQGLLNVWFARLDSLGTSVAMMVIFSIFVQVSAVRYPQDHLPAFMITRKTYLTSLLRLRCRWELASALCHTSMDRTLDQSPVS
jgi:nitrate/nitrite transporter NarK